VKYSTTLFLNGHRISLLPGLLLPSVLCLGCGEPAPLTADMPLHLEDHLDAATVVGSEVPADLEQTVEWHFNEPQPDWKPLVPLQPTIQPIRIARTDDGLQLRLTEENRHWPDFHGGIYVDLPDWEREDWGHILVRARTSDDVDHIEVGFNLREVGSEPGRKWPLRYDGDQVPVITDGSVQTYRFRADWPAGVGDGPWQQLGIEIGAPAPASLDILSVSLVPKEADYSDELAGVREEVRNRVYRRALYTHAPGRLEYRVQVPEAARLDLGLGVLRDDSPVTFQVTALDGGGRTHNLFEETYAAKEGWGQRSVDLSSLAGQTVTLVLAAESERPGTVALWGAPTLTGAAKPDLPNIVFYVIDGGAADFMSVYGYNRRTTPNIEKLAAEGAVFERAYSNSSWTRPSTASFMTSLQNSVMGGFLNWNDPVPEEAVTMAEHMHQSGYQTAVFTANPNAGTLSNLQRGVDLFREDWEDFSYFGGNNHRESSRFLHEGFWSWREAYPAEPYWAHFQTTDVHEDFPAVAPFAGRFVGPAEREKWSEWNERLREAGGHGIYSEAWDSTGISRTAFFSLHQGMYDETMAHNDYQLGRLVERLKAEGEWENTLLIIGGDHSTRAAMDDMVVLLDSLPPPWGHPMFRPTISRVPLIFVWPGHIEGGQRFDQPVSMIDVLPTLLDLVGLPPAEVAQGQSLAPLLRGEDGWEPRPVILDEFQIDRETGELRGVIEVVDGRWGASLEINPRPAEEDEDEEEAARRRPVPLLLYDLWNDPFCVTSVHEERPDLVEKYTAFLEAQWEAHQALAQLFTPSESVALTPEQLRTLRALGYIQ
jgi:arylsulfatase A-like enzyme